MKNFLLVVFTLYFFKVHSQSEPTQAPSINAFQLKENNLGAIANSVNLFTGSLNLPLELVSLPGRNGLGINVSIFYNSSVRHIVDVWNLDAPTSTLGLGWSLLTTQIIVDNKMTGNREDDEFYLTDSNSASKLICVANNSGTKTFISKVFKNWIITYYSESEKWEIVKEDGTKYVYGDQYSNRETVQWVVKWGNWIGNSRYLYIGQGRQALAWNLSEVISIVGDKITYAYLGINVKVGGGDGHRHTEASYISRITSSWGDELIFNYDDKLTGEYIEPHTEKIEPDAYQERYEKKFLSGIIVKTNNTFGSEIKFEYATDLFGSNDFLKRVLIGIKQISHSGSVLKGPSFYYEITGFMRGALNEIKSPYGGSVRLIYHPTGIDIGFSDLYKEALSPNPNTYSEPRVFVEDDYTLVTWRQQIYGSVDSNPSPVEAEVYTWDAGWKKKSLGSIGSVKLLNDEYQDFLVATAKDFFAILRPDYTQGSHWYWLYLWHKDDRVAGNWIKSEYYIHFGSHDTEQERLLVGNNFVVATNNKGVLYRYVWNGDSWNYSIVTESTHTHFTAAKNNYIISQNTAPNPDEITVYYLDETNNWKSSVNTDTFNNGSGETFWHLGNSFAVAMASGGNEHIFHINSNYSLTRKSLDFAYPDNSRVFITDESMVTVIGSNNGKIRALRYDGIFWRDSGDRNFYNMYQSSAGSDAIIWESDGQLPTLVRHIKSYNPNSGWTTDITNTFSPNSLVINPSIMGHNWYLASKDIYFRQPSGNWNDVGDIYFDPQTTKAKNGKYRMGVNFFTYESDTPKKLYLQFFKNNLLSSRQEIPGKTCLPRYSSKAFSNYNQLFGRNSLTLTTYFDNFLYSKSLHLHRIIDEKISGHLKSYPIIRIEVLDGIKTYNTTIEYTANTATLQGSIPYAQYNKVTVINGSSSATSRPYGRTETYFFNGLSEQELGDTFPVDGDVGNAPLNYKLLTGLIYRTKVFDSDDNLVFEENTVWNVIKQNVSNGVFKIDKVSIPLVYKSISFKDGIQVHAVNDYHSQTNQLMATSRFVKYASGHTQEVKNEFTYAWEKYPACQALNIIAPIIQTRKKVNDLQYTECAFTRWKEWSIGPNTIPAPYDQFVWKGTGSNIFTAWNTSINPGIDWKFISRINKRDNLTGLSLESESSGNHITSKIYNNSQKYLIADIVNSSVDNVIYHSFEEIDEHFSLDAICGLRSFTSTINIELPSSGTYLLTYWKKIGDAPWQLITEELTANKIIGGSGILLDEVRLHPLNARMTTYSYDLFGNLLSVNDDNNIITYYEYDEFNRLILVRDQDRNIVKHNFLNIKQ